MVPTVFYTTEFASDMAFRCLIRQRYYFVKFESTIGPNLGFVVTLYFIYVFTQTSSTIRLKTKAFNPYQRAINQPIALTNSGSMVSLLLCFLWLVFFILFAEDCAGHIIH
jgi:hypothetical protein